MLVCLLAGSKNHTMKSYLKIGMGTKDMTTSLPLLISRRDATTTTTSNKIQLGCSSNAEQSVQQRDGGLSQASKQWAVGVLWLIRAMAASSFNSLTTLLTEMDDRKGLKYNRNHPLPDQKHTQQTKGTFYLLIGNKMQLGTNFPPSSGFEGTHS